MQVQVTQVFPDLGSTVWTADGIVIETGEQVRFGGDWRPMRDIWVAVTNGEEPVADVPEWALLSQGFVR